jgi:hypothetical protein
MFRNDVIVTGDGEIEVAKRVRSISFGSLAQPSRPPAVGAQSSSPSATSCCAARSRMLIAVFTHVARQKIDTDNAVDATFT